MPDSLENIDLCDQARNSQAGYPDQRNTLLPNCTQSSFLYQAITIMGDHDYPATCLSSFEHGNDVRDVVIHYFGCLREAEREVYFKQLPHHKQDRITKERNRILEQRALFEVNDRTKDLVRKFRKSLRQLPFVRGRTGDTRHSGDDLVKLCKENAWGMSAYVIFFRNSERYTDPNCSDHFPNQKLDVKDLLYNKDEKTKSALRTMAFFAAQATHRRLICFSDPSSGGVSNMADITMQFMPGI
jgi:hypothetical protein